MGVREKTEKVFEETMAESFPISMHFGEIYIAKKL